MFRALAQNRADRRRDIGRGKRRGCDLIEQRLEKMIIGAVDHRHPHRFAREFLRRLQTAESGADNYDVRLLFVARLPCRVIFEGEKVRTLDIC